MTKIYGYVRVSTKHQNIDRQVSALKSSGIKYENIYVDKCTGVNFERAEYEKLINKLKEGDILYIKSIDRLGRNYDEIIEQWNLIVKSKHVDIVVLDFPLLDTRAKKDGVTGKFISDMTLQILSYVAQIEKENTHQRQMEGIVEARKRGVKFGRPQKEVPSNFEYVRMLWIKNEISQREAGRMLGVNHTTFKKWAMQSIVCIE